MTAVTCLSRRMSGTPLQVSAPIACFIIRCIRLLLSPLGHCLSGVVRAGSLAYQVRHLCLRGYANRAAPQTSHDYCRSDNLSV
jgi:hypothetical protein